jgi:hypothetical protein
LKNIDLSELEKGDLVRVDWFDASRGQALTIRGRLDIPVYSWGIYLGVLGQKRRHIVLAQNSFKLNNEFYDVDYTSIPVSFLDGITVIHKAELPPNIAELLLLSFTSGRRRIIKERTVNA